MVAGAGARGPYEAGLPAHLLPEVAARTQTEGRVARFSFNPAESTRFGSSDDTAWTKMAYAQAVSSDPDTSSPGVGVGGR